MAAAIAFAIGVLLGILFPAGLLVFLLAALIVCIGCMVIR